MKSIDTRRIAAMTAFCAMLTGCSPAPDSNTVTRSLGAASTLGGGSVAGYAESDAAGALTAIGVVFSAAVVDDPPAGPSDGHHCTDLNGDGSIDVTTECSMWHERVLPLPGEASRRPDVPFKWALVNWNPHGHIPPGVYDKPHFDVHFYIQPIEDVFAITSGPCGPERVRCDQFERARLPVPAGYMHADYQEVGAVAPAMGNHLVDPTAAEFHGMPFTRTWIYGTYDGHVTFYEEMATLDYLKTQPAACIPIKAVPAVETSGYYPTQSCVRYSGEKAEYTVSIEGFKFRAVGEAMKAQ